MAIHNSPRIFVGTLTCGEAEFKECCAAIASQKGVSVTHHIIRNLPEYEAHNALWEAWDAARSTHDLFVKIDADTVLNRDSALAEIAQLFEQADVTGAQIALLDFFTEDLINGLNVFSPAVVFRPSRTRLFADHADTGHKIVLKGEVVKHLAPIGWHGRNPHPEQAFHYGFHRRLKKQSATLSRLARAWQMHQDSAREWALAGAASAKWWMRFGTDYQSFWFRRMFDRCQDASYRHAMAQKLAGALS